MLEGGSHILTLTLEGEEIGAKLPIYRSQHDILWWTNVIMCHTEDQAQQEEAAQEDQRALKRSYVLLVRARFVHPAFRRLLI